MIPTLKLLHDRCNPVGSCMLWEQATSSSGVPYISVDGRTVSARRLAYTLAHGPIPPGKFISPKCKHKACISEVHLVALSRSQYARTSAKRGVYDATRRLGCTRAARARSTLNPEVVAAIRLEREQEGATYLVLAAKWGTSPGNMYHICNYKSWRPVARGASIFHP